MWTQSPGVAMVRSVIITLAQRLQTGCNILLALNVIGIAEELAALLLEYRLCLTLDCEVAIFNLLHSKWFLANFVE